MHYFALLWTIVQNIFPNPLYFLRREQHCLLSIVLIFIVTNVGKIQDIFKSTFVIGTFMNTLQPMETTLLFYNFIDIYSCCPFPIDQKL
jgi:hypothetical protein